MLGFCVSLMSVSILGMVRDIFECEMLEYYGQLTQGMGTNGVEVRVGVRGWGLDVI